MAKDPYRYFRVEARELLEGISKGILHLEKDGSTTEAVGSLLRLAHTLKGAARVVKQNRISELAHALEEILSPFRDGKTVVPKDQVNHMLRELDAMTAAVALLNAGANKSENEFKSDAPKERPASEEPLETVRISIAEMDKLLEGISAASAQLTVVRRDVHAVQRAAQLSGMLYEQLNRKALRMNSRLELGANAQLIPAAEELQGALGRAHEGLTVNVDQLSTELQQIGEAANQLRLLPANAIFGPLERTARDAAQSLQKVVAFEAIGGETRLDAHVLAALRDALLHVVRNAVAHGIETDALRKAAGKPPTGVVKLTVERRGNRVAFTCRDDGKGIDVKAIRKAAVERGLVPADKANSLEIEDAIDLILKGGVTTTGNVTEVSGRGIGLDVVRTTASRLKGTIAVRTELGRETSVEICVPISLASLTALRVEAGGVIAAIPLDCVRKTILVAESDLARSGDSISVVCDGRSIVFVSLRDMLKLKSNGTHSLKSRTAVIVNSLHGDIALGVERLLGTSSVVIRPLPTSIQVEPFVTGATFDADGNPELIIDPFGISTAATLVGQSQSNLPAAARLPIMVIDDSLTTRMLEQSILESAGYKVELAVSAEDALEKTRDRKHGIFIVDVEMPGMSGFEFVEHVQADPALRDIPCILVTSRNAPEDKLRGQKAGARSYIVKSEFNQDSLLQTIRGLLG